MTCFLASSFHMSHCFGYGRILINMDVTHHQQFGNGHTSNSFQRRIVLVMDLTSLVRQLPSRHLLLDILSCCVLIWTLLCNALCLGLRCMWYNILDDYGTLDTCKKVFFGDDTFFSCHTMHWFGDGRFINDHQHFGNGLAMISSQRRFILLLNPGFNSSAAIFEVHHLVSIPYGQRLDMYRTPLPLLDTVLVERFIADN